MKKVIILILKIVFIVLVLAWVALIFTEYFRAKNESNPRFCISEEVREYNNGNLVKTYSMDEFDALSDSVKENMNYTYACTGLGYKFYRYNREFKAVEFGPFFIEERQSMDN